MAYSDHKHNATKNHALGKKQWTLVAFTKFPDKKKFTILVPIFILSAEILLTAL